MPRHAAADFVLKLLFLTEDALSQRPLSGGTVLEDLPGGVRKLSVIHLPWAADLHWIYFFRGLLPPPP